MAFRAVDALFTCSLQITDGNIYPVRQSISHSESLDILYDLEDIKPDIAHTRWHMEVSDTYPKGQPLGSDLSHIIRNISPFIYQRGGRIYSDLMWEISSKTPKLKQFVLTTSDYCKLYVTVLSWHIRRRASLIPLDCGEEFVHVPISVGLMSRLPYLTFPKIFLSHLYHACSHLGLYSILCSSISQLMHGIPIPIGPSSLTTWNLPSLTHLGSHNHVALYMGDVGIDGTPMEENSPIQSAFTRSFTEVDIVALFDVLSVEVIISVINALVLEQKVLLISSKWPSSFIAHLCEAFRVLLYPFDWQHVYIPLIPTVDVTDSQAFPPYWLGSARSKEHVHPLRYLDVPAPVFGGVKFRSSIEGVCEIFVQRFPDVNIVDLDNDIVFSAVNRIDGEECDLPQFPRKLSQLVISRLSTISEKFCMRNRPTPAGGRDRIERYMHWDKVVEIFGVYSSTDAVSRRNSLSSVSSVQGGSFMRPRRSSMTRSMPVSSRTSGGSWKGGFASFFRSRQHSRSSSLERASSEGNIEPTDLVDDGFNFELLATEIIQSAFIEAFVRIFFAYHDFIVISAAGGATSSTDGSPNTGGDQTPSGSLFTGGDRIFQTRQFLKSIERHGIFGSDSLSFIQTLVTATQCWDIFIRTSALNHSARLFDTACSYYRSINRVEYLKFRQMNLSIILRPNERFATLPEDIGTLISPPPLNKKPREIFFEQLSDLLRQRRSMIDTVAIAPFHRVDDRRCDTHEDVWASIKAVLSSNLGSGNANVEAVKFSPTRSPPSDMNEFVENFLHAFSKLLDEKPGKRHFLHAILGMSESSPKEARSSQTPPIPFDEVVKPPGTTSPRLWRSPGGLFRGITAITGSNTWEEKKKILGGIPKSALLEPVPAVPSFLFRDYRYISYRVFHVIHGISNIDYSCQNCGSCEPLGVILERGNFWSLVHADTVTVDCLQCRSHVHVTLYSSADRGIQLRALRSTIDSIVELPMDFSTHVNILFLIGTFFEIYTNTDLRGIVSLFEILRDFVAWTAQDTQDVNLVSEVVERESTPVVPLLDTATSAVSMPDSPRSRAIWRIRQYRAKEPLVAPGSAVPRRSPTIRNKKTVIRINVDESISPKGPPIGDPTSSFRRRSQRHTTDSPRIKLSESPTASSPAKSSPIPPSERRPTEAAPRRLAYRKSNASSAPSH